MTEVLKAEPRKTKKSVLNQLRRTGFIPAIVYGDEIENKAISISEQAFTKLYRKVGRNGVFSLEIENDAHPVMVYDLQVDPLKNLIIHADFYKVNMNVEVDAEVPIQLVGEAPGEKEGGIVQHSLYEVNVRALPAKLPTNIEVSIDRLQIGDSILVGDLPKSTDYVILNNEDEAIVSVLTPSVEEESDSGEAEVEDAKEQETNEENKGEE
ncbi:50S ribosomal protein L25/general stress protein Ctc [Pueribacillus theae]|nr:50S ribosomal protein L25/general stress protein Ctc [Pueribacillus theae]